MSINHSNNQKTVLFLAPPEDYILPANQPELLESTKDYKAPIEFHMPKLGLLSLAGYLEKHGQADIKILDSGLEKISYHNLPQKIKDINADVIAMSVLSFTLIDVIKTAKLIKKLNPNIIIILGGPHVNIYPTETLNIAPIDYIILGEGEITFTELVNNLDNKEIIKTIKGLIFKEENKIINTGLREPLKDLDHLPFPARHLTPYKDYASLLTKQKPVTTMITSRGCPYKCTFCDRPHLGKIFRKRSAENVMAEMELCQNMGIKEILIYDDTFTANRKRVIDICHLLIEKGIKIKWDIRTRVDTVDFELLKLLKKAGCTRIHYGVEAGTEKILKVLNKDITIPQVIKTFNDTKKAGIETLAYFMIGSPTENLEDINQTLELAKKLKADYVHFAILTPFPATEIYTRGLKKGIFKHDYWQKFASLPDPNFIPPFWTENFSREELINLLFRLHQKFYLRPSIAVKEIFKLRSFEELKNKFQIFLRILTLKNK